MSLPSTLVWEVRATGNSLNGGGFDPSVASPGTDYSQQDSPQVTYSDLVIGATNTQATSAAHPFTAAHVGNVLNIPDAVGVAPAGGVNFQALGTVTVTGTTLKVVTTASGNGQSVADAVRVFPAGRPDLATILDDSSGAGYAETGTWSGFTGGYNNTQRYILTSGSQPTATATWTFSGLSPGTYTVQATWPANASNSTNQPYALYDGTTLSTTVNVDQHVAPAPPTSPASIGRYEVTSVSGATATFDRALGTAGTTGVVAYLGGALDHPGTAASAYVNGNTVYVKSGTYLHGSTANGSGNRLNVSAQVAIHGYTATRGDNAPTRPIMQANAPSIAIWTMNSNFTVVRNIDFYRDPASGQTNVSGLSVASLSAVERCRARNCNGFSGLAGGFVATGGGSTFRDCQADACGQGFTTQSANVSHLYCVATSCTSSGFIVNVNSGSYYCCVALGCSPGFNLGGGTLAAYCDAINNSSSGFSGNTGVRVVRCRSEGNFGYGYLGTMRLLECSGYNNTSGNYDNPGGVNVDSFVALTAASTTNAAALDLSPNNAAGGGALLRGIARTLPGLAGTSYPDLGAFQHQDAGGRPSSSGCALGGGFSF